MLLNVKSNFYLFLTENNEIIIQTCTTLVTFKQNNYTLKVHAFFQYLVLTTNINKTLLFLKPIEETDIILFSNFGNRDYWLHIKRDNE